MNPSRFMISTLNRMGDLINAVSDFLSGTINGDICIFFIERDSFLIERMKSLTGFYRYTSLIQVSESFFQ